MRLRASDGRLVRGRCRAANQCDYCARLAAVENSEVLALDAIENGAPGVWVVLTTRTPELSPRPFYRAREAVMRAIQRRWPDAEYAALVEFTTGYGSRSGGRRRPHWNLLLKGVPADALDELREVVCRIWCGRVDATPAGQFAGTVSEAGGLMRYLALHFQKESQKPPAGWRGHRFMHSHGYFAEGIETMRGRAREQLQFRRELWKFERLAEQAGVELLPDELDELASASMERQRALTWEAVRVVELATAPRADVVRQSWADARKAVATTTDKSAPRTRAPTGASRPSGAAARLGP